MTNCYALTESSGFNNHDRNFQPALCLYFCMRSQKQNILLFNMLRPNCLRCCQVFPPFLCFDRMGAFVKVYIGASDQRKKEQKRKRKERSLGVTKICKCYCILNKLINTFK